MLEFIHGMWYLPETVLAGTNFTIKVSNIDLKVSHIPYKVMFLRFLLDVNSCRSFLLQTRFSFGYILTDVNMSTYDMQWSLKHCITLTFSTNDEFLTKIKSKQFLVV